MGGRKEGERKHQRWKRRGKGVRKGEAKVGWDELSE